MPLPPQTGTPASRAIAFRRSRRRGSRSSSRRQASKMTMARAPARIASPITLFHAMRGHRQDCKIDRPGEIRQGGHGLDALDGRVSRVHHRKTARVATRQKASCHEVSDGAGPRRSADKGNGSRRKQGLKPVGAVPSSRTPRLHRRQIMVRSWCVSRHDPAVLREGAAQALTNGAIDSGTAGAIHDHARLKTA